MRPTGLGLVAALVVSLLAPATAMAAAKPGPPVYDAKEQLRGKTEVPPLLTAAGVPCQMSDARYLGTREADKKAKTPETSYYEAACGAGNMGYMITVAKDQKPEVNPCVMYPDPAGLPKGNLTCALPDNSGVKTAFAKAIALSKINCVPVATRPIGQSASNSFIEVACPGDIGYVAIAPLPYSPTKPMEMANCLSTDGADNKITCTLISKDKRIAVTDRYNAQAKTGCVIKDRRFVGMSTEGNTFFETSCADGKGYMFKVAPDDSAVAIECSKAQALLNGCTLTDSRQAASEQAGLYTRLAKKAGSNCDVKSYAPFSLASADDIVEMTCADGSAAVGVFKATGSGQVADCAYSLLIGYRCGPSHLANVNQQLTADLRKFDKKDCAVSDSKPYGKSDKGTGLIEVACADGLKGYLIEYKLEPTVVAVGATNCAFGGCSLPANTKK